MKIIGFTLLDGNVEMLLKADSALLVNRKPFFVPDGSSDIRWTRCIVLRVSRLGKNIAERFAERYYDAIAPGLDMRAEDWLREARTNGHSWTRATAFDYSLVVGDWQAPEDIVGEPIISPAEAIHRASQTMTIRQGDLVYICMNQPATQAQRETVITGPLGQEQQLYCKIK